MEKVGTVCIVNASLFDSLDLLARGGGVCVIVTVCLETWAFGMAFRYG